MLEVLSGFLKHLLATNSKHHSKTEVDTFRLWDAPEPAVEHGNTIPAVEKNNNKSGLHIERWGRFNQFRLKALSQQKALRNKGSKNNEKFKAKS